MSIWSRTRRARHRAVAQLPVWFHLHQRARHLVHLCYTDADRRVCRNANRLCRLYIYIYSLIDGAWWENLYERRARVVYVSVGNRSNSDRFSFPTWVWSIDYSWICRCKIVPRYRLIKLSIRDLAEVLQLVENVGPIENFFWIMYYLLNFTNLLIFSLSFLERALSERDWNWISITRRL